MPESYGSMTVLNANSYPDHEDLQWIMFNRSTYLNNVKKLLLVVEERFVVGDNVRVFQLSQYSAVIQSFIQSNYVYFAYAHK